LASRKNKGGRPGRHVNLFAGLLHDARDGGALHQAHKGKKGGGPQLVSYRAVNGAEGSKNVSFPLEPFERSILSLLREIDLHEILPGNGAAERVLVLTGKFEEAEAQVKKIKAKLIASGDCDDLADVLRAWVAKRDAAAAELAEAQREVATPLS